MYLSTGHYCEASAFVMGCDAGNHFGLLPGFREWLIIRLNGCENLNWSSLVLRVAFPDRIVTEDELTNLSETNKTAINALFDLVIEFLNERNSRDGLASIYFRYFTWIEERS